MAPSSNGSPPPSGSNRERSGNAKAQARHRAKRKAYIEHLESTVLKLQCLVPLTQDQINALSPAQQRVRELEEENTHLRAEIGRLSAQLAPLSQPAVRGPGITGMFADDDSAARRMRYELRPVQNFSGQVVGTPHDTSSPGSPNSSNIDPALRDPSNSNHRRLPEPALSQLRESPGRNLPPLPSPPMRKPSGSGEFH